MPKIRTKALDANTGLNQVKADSNATVVDTVTYENLLPGKKYTMKVVLMTSAGNSSDGKRKNHHCKYRVYSNNTKWIS